MEASVLMVLVTVLRVIKVNSVNKKVVLMIVLAMDFARITLAYARKTTSEWIVRLSVVNGTAMIEASAI